MDSEESQNLPLRASSDVEALSRGITTRILAERLRTLSQEQASTSERRDSIPNDRRRSSSIGEDSRKFSRFLAGTNIPNSVIKASMKVVEPPRKNSETLRRERDEHVSQILEKYLPKFNRQSYDEARDLEALAKIRKELQRRSLLMEQEEQKENKEPRKETVTNTDAAEDLDKQKRRLSRRTELFSPLTSARAPTFESVKRAVENASDRTSKGLINADELMPKPRRSSDVEETPELVAGRQPSSFISRRKFVSKSEKGNKSKEHSLEILQPGINRPSMTLERSETERN